MNLIKSWLLGCFVGVAIFSSVFLLTDAFRPADPLAHIYKLFSGEKECTAFIMTDGERSVMVTATHCVGPDMVAIGRDNIYFPTIITSDPKSDVTIMEAIGIEQGTGLPWQQGETLPSNSSEGKVIGFLADISPVPIIQSVIIGWSAATDDVIRFFTIGCPVWPGTSGGPLLDAHGHVVGVASATYSLDMPSIKANRDLGIFVAIFSL